MFKHAAITDIDDLSKTIDPCEQTQVVRFTFRHAISDNAYHVLCAINVVPGLWDNC